MKFDLFKQLYSEAIEYSEVDYYVTERGWQEWMDEFENIGEILHNIYTLANSTIKETREKLGVTRVSFGRKYSIPTSTLEKWETGKSESPLYVKLLIDYAIFVDDLNG